MKKINHRAGWTLTLLPHPVPVEKQLSHASPASTMLGSFPHRVKAHASFGKSMNQKWQHIFHAELLPCLVILFFIQSVISHFAIMSSFNLWFRLTFHWDTFVSTGGHRLDFIFANAIKLESWTHSRVSRDDPGSDRERKKRRDTR